MVLRSVGGNMLKDTKDKLKKKVFPIIPMGAVR